MEAHGTGTPVGDPIEAKAIGAVISVRHTKDAPCLMGSVKSNLGHLEPASGIAGLCKLALALYHRTIPPTLHLEKPNPKIPFDELNLRVPIKVTPWPKHGPEYDAEKGPGKGNRDFGGVNSFGFGGTNAHVVLQGVEEAPYSPAPEAGENRYLFTLSARSEPALDAYAEGYLAFLESETPLPSLRDICYSAAIRRTHYPYRLIATVASVTELTDKLRAFLGGETRSGLASNRTFLQPGQTAFVFSGQGVKVINGGAWAVPCCNNGTPIFVGNWQR